MSQNGHTGETPGRVRAAIVVALIVVAAIVAFLVWTNLRAPPGGDGLATSEPGVADSTVGGDAGDAGRPAAEPSSGTAPSDTAAGGAGAGELETAATTPGPVEGDVAVPGVSAAGAAPVAPSFDIVRINPEGLAVIAGRAEPGAEVTIKEGDAVIAEVTADRRGEWVAVVEEAIGSGTRELALVERTGKGEVVESESVVVLSVPEPAPSPDTEAESAGSQGALAVLVPRESVGGSAVLQEPSSGVGIKGPGKLSLDIVEYDEEGRVAIGGRAGPGERVHVYLDNRFVGAAEAGPDETWRVTPEARVAPGLHTLRIDQVDDEGTVIARIETPFSRADLQVPSGADALVVVQPGNSLWRIARRTYGRGIQYVHIFEANRDQIRDEDLIYPGQIFVLPRIN